MDIAFWIESPFSHVFSTRLFWPGVLRAHLHMAKNLSTKCQRIVNEGFFFAGEVFLRRIFNLILIFSAKLLFFCNF